MGKKTQVGYWSVLLWALNKCSNAHEYALRGHIENDVILERMQSYLQSYYGSNNLIISEPRYGYIRYIPEMDNGEDVGCYSECAKSRGAMAVTFVFVAEKE